MLFSAACRPNFLFSDGPHTYALALADLDGDGDLDAYLANGANEVPVPDQVWLNAGSGNFINSGQIIGNNETHHILLMDVNADGDQDALVDNAGAFQVRFNDGTGGFLAAGQAIFAQDVGAYLYAIAPGDLNGDSRPDLFLGVCCGAVLSNGVNQFLPPSNMVWLNVGQGNFKDTRQRLGSAGSEAAALGDLDADGDLDAFVANSSSMNSAQSGSSPHQPDEVWLNDGQGFFANSGQSLGSSNSHALALGDLDGDFDLDALIGSDAAFQVWYNDGQANYHHQGMSPNPLPQRNDPVLLVQLGDLDADGDLDALLWQRGLGTILLNDGSGGFTTAAKGFPFPGCDAASLGDLDGDGDLDIFAFLYPDQPRAWLNDGTAGFTPLAP